jgi:hypothetical protein
MCAFLGVFAFLPVQNHTLTLGFVSQGAARSEQKMQRFAMVFAMYTLRSPTSMHRRYLSAKNCL